MAIEYTLHVNAEEHDIARIDAFLRSGPAQANAAQHPPIQVTPRRPDPRSAGFVNETYGVMPTVRLTVRLDKFQLQESERETARLTLALLKIVAGDVLLLKNGELVALRRLAGVVRIDPRRALWSPAALRELEKGFPVGRPLDGESLL